MQGLESLGLQDHQYGSFLIPVVMAKLPADVCLQIARVTTKDIWKINELLEVLRTEVEATEISIRVRVHEIRSSTNPSNQQQPI